MDSLNNSLFTNIAVDMGDLRIDFLGRSDPLSPLEVNESPLHLHTRHEFQYIISGTLQAFLEEETALEVSSGTGLLIPPNMLHRISKGDGQRLALTITIQQLPSMQSTSFSEFQYYCELLGQLHTPIIIKDDTVTYCVNELLSMPDTAENLHKKKNLLALLFIRIATHVNLCCPSVSAETVITQGNQRNQQYFLIEQFINTHYNKKATVEQIAEILHVSRRQADRIILEIFGKTYAALVLERRMSIAQTMLKKTDMPCVDISEMVGYNSYAGFFIAFKQYFQMTPEEMRKIR